MKFEVGNKRGRGRPKGSLSKRTTEFHAVLEKHNFCAASAMIEIYEEAKKVYSSYAVIYEAIVQAKSAEAGYPAIVEDKADKYLRIAGDMAKEISSYAYPKRKAIEQSVDQELLDIIKSLEGKSTEELLALLKQNS
jgi:hypothetical protein